MLPRCSAAQQASGSRCRVGRYAAEIQPANPNYTPNVFCYAAKEHVELETPGQIFFPYACNSFQASDVTNNMNL